MADTDAPAKREAPRWEARAWRGRESYGCTRCPFATTDKGEMIRHARSLHRLVSEGGSPNDPFRGIEFASPQAQHEATIAGLDRHALLRATAPTGKGRRFTVSDVRLAVRASTPDREI